MALWLDTNDNSVETLWALVLVQVKLQKSRERTGRAVGSKRSQPAWPASSKKHVRTEHPVYVVTEAASSVGAAVGWRALGQARLGLQTGLTHENARLCSVRCEQFTVLCPEGTGVYFAREQMCNTLAQGILSMSVS